MEKDIIKKLKKQVDTLFIVYVIIMVSISILFAYSRISTKKTIDTLQYQIESNTEEVSKLKEQVHTLESELKEEKKTNKYLIEYSKKLSLLLDEANVIVFSEDSFNLLFDDEYK